MTERIAGFRGEYLWELEIAEHHLRALADAIPPDRYGWRPADGARSVSEIMVHVGAGNCALLDMVGVEPPPDLYPPLSARGSDRFLALVMQNHALERRLTDKREAARLLIASLGVAREAITRATDAELDRQGTYFGERTSVRRVYLRLLAHTHEHMGQMIGYVRAMGLKAPWPDPLDAVKSRIAERGA